MMAAMPRPIEATLQRQSAGIATRATTSEAIAMPSVGGWKVAGRWKGCGRRGRRNVVGDIGTPLHGLYLDRSILALTGWVDLRPNPNQAQMRFGASAWGREAKR